jgi:beta-glucosidase
VNPSGKTADTFVKDLFNTPTSNNMGNYAYTNVDDLKETIAAEDAAYEGNIGFVNYVEGIYVGYKFYETASDDGAINYEDYVQYPFGYGLSYTTFSVEMQNFKDNGDSVSFDVVVTNTGSVAGKDAVEIYFTPPYTNGGIEKASVNLIDFAKTGELEPGASETVSFTINKEDLASYDSEGIKIAGGGYILEAGDYTISVREDSHTVLDQATFTVDSDIDYSQTGRSTDETVATNQFEDYSRGDFTQLSRADQFANYTEATAAPSEEDYVMDDETRAAVEANSVVGYDNSQYEDDSVEMPTQGEDGDLSVIDMVGVDYDDPSWETLLNEMTVDEMVQLVNVGGWQTVAVDSIGLVATSDCDGPAGLNNFITGAYGTAYPPEVLMAQTWNKELLREVGESMSQEYKEAGNYGWYGPAMNIHRTAFAGRNFEYFSEDSILSAYLAAEEINGAAENGLYPYVKHFALNDQETNRCSFLMTYASEQAIREIYLKPFEEAIKNYEGTSLAVMSAFNWIGTEPCCGNDNLLKSVLRDEWGFTGLVETDYDGSYGYMITENCIHSGNDLMLGFGTADTNKVDTESASNVVALRQASKDIIYTIANSGYYADGDPTGGISNMTKIFVTVDVIIAVLIIAAETVLILRYRKKKQA